MVPASGSWSTQQLTEFLAVVSSVPEAAAAVREAIERAAEALEAELGAVVTDGAVQASVGFRAGLVPEAELVEVARAGAEAVDLPGIGRCRTAVVPLEGSQPGWLVLARIGEDAFTREDVNLLRGMSRVLTLTLRMLRLLEDERALRQRSQRQAADNARLLASLQERRTLLEQLAKLQHTISHRAPLQEVLDAITAGAEELLGADAVALRLVDANDAAQMVTVSTQGVSPDILAVTRRAPIGMGAAGQAIVDGRLVVMDDYAAAPGAIADFVSARMRSVLAVPVREHGTVVGSIAIGSTDPSRHFSENEQEMLLAYAEQASLALAAAKTVDTMRQAFNDSLTGLANRALFLDRLDHALSRAHRAGTPVSVLFLDLDRFKLVNDSLGHAAGDALLVAAAERIRGVVRGAETIARLGGDEFAVLLENGDDADGAARVAERICAAFAAPFHIGDREVIATASIGIVTGDGAAENLLRDADVAMYRAKASGKGRYRVFEPGMHTEVMARLELEADIQRALERDELVVHYQPIIDLEDGEVRGVEALVRLAHPQRGLVPPSAFVPVAEETGLIVPIGDWVLREACRQVARWQAEHPDRQPLRVSVNLSGRQLSQPGLVAQVREALEESGLAPGTLILELTETEMMQDTEGSIRQLRALKELDVQIAIDDFGTGYSSLGYLQRFPIDILKVAKEFVDGLAEGTDDSIMARAIVALSLNLGLQTVGEGIEEDKQAQRLREVGCELGQGYLFSRPLPAEAITERLRTDAVVTR